MSISLIIFFIIDRILDALDFISRPLFFILGAIYEYRKQIALLSFIVVMVKWISFITKN